MMLKLKRKIKELKWTLSARIRNGFYHVAMNNNLPIWQRAYAAEKCKLWVNREKKYFREYFLYGCSPALKVTYEQMLKEAGF